MALDFGIFRITSDSELKPSLGLDPFRVAGLGALVQQVLVELISDPLPYQSRGSGLRTILLNNTNESDSVVRANITLAVKNTRERVLMLQRGMPNLAASDRLADMTLIGVENKFDSWDIRIRVVNVLNESITFNLPSAS